jgi:ribonucleoside-diphosphate reductase alpha chain
MVRGHEAIKNSTSIADYVFRVLGYEYLNRTDFVHVKPEELKTPDNLKQRTLKVETKAKLKKEDDEETEKIKRAKEMGYVGEPCAVCGSMKVRRNGACTICEDCGSTSGCS